MMEQENQSFEILLEKLMSYQIDKICWSKNMDLVALITVDNIIELTRISYRAQKVFQIEEKQAITSISFSPDSFLLVYGCSDGSIKIIKTENSQKVLVNEKYHLGSIETISWVCYHKAKTEKILPFKKDSIENRLILNISPHVSCDKNSIVKLKYLSEISEQFTFLLSSQKQKTYLNLNGFIPILELNYKELNYKDFTVLFSTYSQKISTIISHEKMDEVDILMVSYHCDELNRLKEDIIKINYLVAYIGQLFAFAQNSYQAVSNQIKDISRQYINKLNLIEDPNNTELVVDPAQELLKYLNLGIATPAVVNFITKQLHDTKFLQKLDETLTNSFMNLQDLELESIQNVFERLTLLLQQLKNLCNVKKYEIFGIDANLIHQFESQIKELYYLGELLLTQSTEAKFDIRNFLVWLNKITIKSASDAETETENMKSYLNKYTVDVSRLREFLSDENRFRLKNLQSLVSGKYCTVKYTQSPISIEQNKQADPSNEYYEHIRQSNFDKILEDLDLKNITTAKAQFMEIQQTKTNITENFKVAEVSWKKIAKIPSEKMNELVTKKYQINKIGSIKLFNDHAPIIKIFDKDNQFFVYYAQNSIISSKLIRFDCKTGSRIQLTAPPGHTIYDIAISSSAKLVLLQRDRNMSLRSISNQFQSNQKMTFDKEMNVQSAQCRIDSSDHGLSSLLMDKNKLVIV